MDIAVLGAGAMGCYFGARLFESGHRVELVDVAPERVHAIRRAGLRVEDDEGERTVPIPARFPGGPARPAELVILFTKAFQGSAALAAARELLGPGTWVLTLQNGLGNLEAVAAHQDAARIVVGTTTIPGDLLGPSQVRSQGRGMTRILSASGAVTERLEALARALSLAGLPCEIATDVWARIWEKVALNAALNTLAAVTGLTVGQLGGEPEMRLLAERVAREVTKVARARGIAADLEVVRRALAEAYREHADHRPPMLQDLEAGRRTEVGQINGAVVREAERLGVAVPLTAMLHDLVRVLERRGARPRSPHLRTVVPALLSVRPPARRAP